jgi:DNA repair exonuclease SbcCD ATPase subunit
MSPDRYEIIRPAKNRILATPASSASSNQPAAPGQRFLTRYKTMTNIIDRLFGQLQQRERDISKRNCNDIRSLVRLIGDDELGVASAEVDDDHYAALLDKAGFTFDDLRANVDRYKKRHEQHELALQLDELKQKSTIAENAFRDADLAEGRRRRDALKRLQEMEESARRAQLNSEEAVFAHGELIAGGCVFEEERELNTRLAEIRAQIRKVEAALRPVISDPVAVPGGTWANIDHYPAALVHQTKAAIAEADAEKVACSPERRRQLGSQLTTATARVAERERELKQLTREREEINDQLAKFLPLKMLPENLQIVRAKPTADERRKQTAHKLGYGYTAPIEVQP